MYSELIAMHFNSEGDIRTLTTNCDESSQQISVLDTIHIIEKNDNKMKFLGLNNIRNMDIVDLPNSNSSLPAVAYNHVCISLIAC